MQSTPLDNDSLDLVIGGCKMVSVDSPTISPSPKHAPMVGSISTTATAHPDQAPAFGQMAMFSSEGHGAAIHGSVLDYLTESDAPAPSHESLVAMPTEVSDIEQPAAELVSHTTAAIDSLTSTPLSFSAQQSFDNVQTYDPYEAPDETGSALDPASIDLTWLDNLPAFDGGGLLDQLGAGEEQGPRCGTVPLAPEGADLGGISDLVGSFASSFGR